MEYDILEVNPLDDELDAYQKEIKKRLHRIS